MTRRRAWALLAVAMAAVAGGVVTEVRANNECTGSVIYGQNPDGTWWHGTICTGTCPGGGNCVEMPAPSGLTQCGCPGTLQECCHLEWAWTSPPNVQPAGICGGNNCPPGVCGLTGTHQSTDPTKAKCQ